MTQLSKVSRFDLLVLFFSEKEIGGTSNNSYRINIITVLAQIFQVLESNVPVETVRELKQKY